MLTHEHYNELERQMGRGASHRIYMQIAEGFFCEYCSAAPGSYCTTPDGRPCTAYVHKARQTASSEAVENAILDLTHDAVEARRAERRAQQAAREAALAAMPKPKIRVWLPGQTDEIAELRKEVAALREELRRARVIAPESDGSGTPCNSSRNTSTESA